MANEALMAAYVPPPFQSPVTEASPHVFSAHGDSHKLYNQPMGTRKNIRIIHIGAGFGGINMAYQVNKWMKDVEIVCYEKNAGVGGTWYENKYPGCTCDIPSHSYQFTWALKTDWTSYYSGTDEIEEYAKQVVVDHDLAKYIKLEHTIVKCQWDEQSSKWHVTVKGPDGKEFVDIADVLINGSGILNNWAWPDIPDRESFKGTIIHSARWPKEKLDLKDKRVAVIGVGATAVQIIPVIQKELGHQTIFMRSKTWITPSFAAKYAGPEGANFQYTDEQKQSFIDDPESYHQYRKDLEYEVSTRFNFAVLGSKAQLDTLEAAKKIMRAKLAKKPELMERLVPDFAVGCRRPTPGLQFLETLCEDNVDVVTDKIERFTEKGIKTVDGVEREFDVIVCATGFSTSFIPRFPIIGKDGIDMRDQWADIAEAYLGVTVANFPNYLVTNGPSCPLAQGTILPVYEMLSRYYLKFVQKLQIEPTLRSFSVKPEVIREFQIQRVRAIERLHWSQKCSSWFKRGIPDGPNIALHPGSRLHFFSCFDQPRFEDFDWTYSGNRFAYMGDGFSLREMEKRDMGYYLDDYRADKPFLYEY